MMNEKRKRVIGGAVVFLMVLVFLDRSGAFIMSPGGLASHREAYIQQAALYSAQRSLVEEREMWSEVYDDALYEWERMRSTFVQAGTREIAEEDLRERIAREIEDFGLILAQAVPVRTGPAPEGPIQIIELRLHFAARDPMQVYSVIDRIEHMTDLRIGVVSVEIKGPGIKQLPEQVDARMIIRAIAMIGRDF